ncbi:30S ribosomal protein S2 [Patescibacteria group bacterium]|nr:30S ribosomal protein S2 [Patescibacteria group bacterium]MBU4512426.1 30S ribosomal protein S2 [Patescibacteria group bacterium]MCG2692720.1 30S ribosomal protein S2 [Candidatus Parcubacteria bacterium]
MKIPTLEELLKAGVHFGHKVSKWHPKMAPYIYGNKNGVHIINLEKTVQCLEKVLDYVKKLATSDKLILFVGTKEQAREIVKKAAQECGMPYITTHWVGGMFTNFSIVSQRIKRLKKLEDDKEGGKLKKYTKKEQADFDEEIAKLKELFGGVKDLAKLPDAVFIVDIKREKTVFREAQKKQIPVIAIVDSNVNPEQVDYPIPSNDDGIKALDMIVGLVGEAVKEGKEEGGEKEETTQEIKK